VLRAGDAWGATLDPPRCDDADVLGAFLGGILGYIGRKKGKWMDDMTGMRSVIVDLFSNFGPVDASI